MENYKLEISHYAETVLARMMRKEPGLYKRVVSALDDLASDPFQGKLLKGELKGFYSYRIGSYRVIYKVYREKLLVIVIDIGYRRDIYR